MKFWLKETCVESLSPAGTQSGDVTSPWSGPLSVALPGYYLKTSRDRGSTMCLWIFHQCFIYMLKTFVYSPLMPNLNLTCYTVVIDLVTSFGKLWVRFDSILFITTNTTQILPQYCICGKKYVIFACETNLELKKKYY